MKGKGRRKHCWSNDKCHFAFEYFVVKMVSKCSKTDSNSQNISAVLNLEPRGDPLSGPLNTGLARSTFVLLASLPGKLSEEVAREHRAWEQYLFPLTSLVISGKKDHTGGWSGSCHIHCMFPAQFCCYPWAGEGWDQQLHHFGPNLPVYSLFSACGRP